MERTSSTDFWGGFQKRASAWEHAAELGGLGILAAPSIHTLRGKHMSEKKKGAYELAGLGALAAPTIVKGVKGLLHK